MRFLYDGNYNTNLSITLCKVLCDDHTCWLGIGQNQTSMSLCIGQNQTSMSLWISNHGKYDRKFYIICDGLVTTKGLLEDRVGLFRCINGVEI